MTWVVHAAPFMVVSLYVWFYHQYIHVSEETSRGNFMCGHEYDAKLGMSKLTLIKTLDEVSGHEIERNSFWLLGVEDDFYTMDQIKRSSCYDATVPVIVIFMNPRQNMELDIVSKHYMHQEGIRTWENYDEKIEYYAKHLSDIPSIIVMEPFLFSHTFYSHSEDHSNVVWLAFAIRVEKVIQRFRKSWVYVDAGNALELQDIFYLEHIISILKRMPVGIRGFSINVASFLNNSYNRYIAEEIYCETGLHYIIDTSRNGGEFSTRSLDEIGECRLDPPMINKGTVPSWQPGAVVRETPAQYLAEGVNYNEKILEESEETPDDKLQDHTPDNNKSREKRWSLDSPNDVTSPIYSDDPAFVGGTDGGGGIDASDYGEYGDYGGDYYYDYHKEKTKICVSPTNEEGLDAFAWVKIPGESDGRMFTIDTFHPCLLGHSIECSDRCPQFVPKMEGVFQRSDSCICVDE